MLPDVEGQKRFQTLGKRVPGIGFLGDDEGTIRGGGEPDPAGAEEADAFGDEVGLEGGEGAPLLFNLRFELARRPFGELRDRRFKLREVQVMVQDLAGVVEDGAVGIADDFFQGHRLEFGAGNEAVEVVDIALEVLAVVKADGIGTDNRCQGIGGIG